MIINDIIYEKTFKRIFNIVDINNNIVYCKKRIIIKCINNYIIIKLWLIGCDKL